MDTDGLSAAVCAYPLGDQFGTCCENLKVIGLKILEWYRFDVILLHPDFGQKSLNVFKFVKNRVLEQITNNEQIKIYNNKIHLTAISNFNSFEF